MDGLPPFDRLRMTDVDSAVYLHARHSRHSYHSYRQRQVYSGDLFQACLEGSHCKFGGPRILVTRCKFGSDSGVRCVVPRVNARKLRMAS